MKKEPEATVVEEVKEEEAAAEHLAEDEADGDATPKAADDSALATPIPLPASADISQTDSALIAEAPAEAVVGGD